jgi:hypothetical protein
MFDAVGYNYHSIGEIIKFLEIDLIPITSEMDFYIYPSVIHSDDTCLTAVRSPLISGEIISKPRLLSREIIVLKHKRGTLLFEVLPVPYASHRSILHPPGYCYYGLSASCIPYGTAFAYMSGYQPAFAASRPSCLTGLQVLASP